MKNFFYIIFIASALAACKKGPGEGGRASISGKIFSVNYNASMTSAVDSGYLGNQRVSIIYGDDIAASDDQLTNYDGSYEFKYLRKGQYKIFTYTKVNINYIDSAIVQPVEITEKKQTVTLPDFKIKTTKN